MNDPLAEVIAEALEAAAEGPEIFAEDAAPGVAQAVRAHLLSDAAVGRAARQLYKNSRMVCDGLAGWENLPEHLVDPPHAMWLADARDALTAAICHIDEGNQP